MPSRVPAPKPVDVVRSYNQALGAVNVDAMLAFVHEDCEIVSPRGVMRGHESVRAFAARQSYGVRMVPAEQRYFARGETVVVHGTVEWRYVESDELAGRDDGATVWTIRNGRIARLEIHEELGPALASAGLTGADEVSDP
jgi:ketosteroid isomerase-like protein